MARSSRRRPSRLVIATRLRSYVDMSVSGKCTELAADAVRAALLTRDGPLDPYGLRIRNAIITGQLDLSSCVVAAPIRFMDCTFTDPLLVDGAELDSLAIVGGISPDTPGHSSVPGFLGNGLKVQRDLNLSRTVLSGLHSTSSSVSRSAAIWLTEAEIGGRLLGVGTTITTGASPKSLDRAIQADRCQIRGDVRFIQGFRTDAEVRFLGAGLGGSLDLAGAEILSRTGRALDLAESTIAGSIFVTESPEHQSSVEGRIELGRASINGRILIRNASITGPPVGHGRHLYNLQDPANRIAILGQGASIRGELTLDGNTIVRGAIALPRATILGGICLDGATIDNPGDFALQLGHARIEGGISASPMLHRPATIRGTVDIDGANILGSLHFRDLAISAPAYRYCITARHVTVSGDINMVNARIGCVEGVNQVALTPGTPPACDTGGVSLRGADILGIVDAEGAWIDSSGDAALNLHQARVGGNIRLCGGFSSLGLVLLNRAVVEGRLRCDSGRFTWRPRHTADTRGAEANVRAAAFEAISANFRGGVGLGWTISGAVDFTDAMTTYLADSATGGGDWPRRKSYLSGFTYQRYASIGMNGRGDWDWRTRADWLAAADPAPQGMPGDPGPWEQAARTLARHGDPGGGENILMRYQATNRQRRVGVNRYFLPRVFDLVFNQWFRGYGYRPLRALVPLAILIVVVAIMLTPAGWNHAMRTTDPTGAIYTPQGQLDGVVNASSTPECGEGKVRCFSPWLYAIDTVVPIVDLKQRSTWSPSVDSGGAVLFFWLNVATLIGWAISSVLVVGIARVGGRSLKVD